MNLRLWYLTHLHFWAPRLPVVRSSTPAQWKTDVLWVLQALLSLCCPLAPERFPISLTLCLWFIGASDRLSRLKTVLFPFRQMLHMSLCSSLALPRELRRTELLAIPQLVLHHEEHRSRLISDQNTRVALALWWVQDTNYTTLEPPPSHTNLPPSSLPLSVTSFSLTLGYEFLIRLLMRPVCTPGCTCRSLISAIWYLVLQGLV